MRMPALFISAVFAANAIAAENNVSVTECSGIASGADLKVIETIDSTACAISGEIAGCEKTSTSVFKVATDGSLTALKGASVAFKQASQPVVLYSGCDVEIASTALAAVTTSAGVTREQLFSCVETANICRL